MDGLGAEQGLESCYSKRGPWASSLSILWEQVTTVGPWTPTSCTRLHSRGSRKVPPTSRGATFPPHCSRGLILSLRGRERIRGIPVPHQEEALSRGKTRGTPESCPHSQSPPDVSESKENGVSIYSKWIKVRKGLLWL